MTLTEEEVPIFRGVVTEVDKRDPRIRLYGWLSLS